MAEKAHPLSIWGVHSIKPRYLFQNKKSPFGGFFVLSEGDRITIERAGSELQIAAEILRGHGWRVDLNAESQFPCDAYRAFANLSLIDHRRGTALIKMRLSPGQAFSFSWNRPALVENTCFKCVWSAHSGPADSDSSHPRRSCKPCGCRCSCPYRPAPWRLRAQPG